MIDKELAEKLLEFLRNYLNFYKSFLEIESKKYSDLANNNVATLDAHVRNEEAFMLKARGLELERDKLVAQAGGPKSTFRQLIPMFEPALQPQAKSIFDELSQVTLNLKETNLRCNQLTELKLHKIEKDINILKNNPELQRIYS